MSLTYYGNPHAQVRRWAHAPPEGRRLAERVRARLVDYLWYTARREWWSFTVARALLMLIDAGDDIPLSERVPFVFTFVVADRRWLRARGGRA